jgi:transposase InsO family protein
MCNVNSSTKIVRNKIGLLNLAMELNNISKACRVMGVSRDTFYRYQHAREEGGIEALVARNRKVPNLRNRVDFQIEEAIVKKVLENPAYGPVRISNELLKEGTLVSASGVRSVLVRRNLENTKRRLLYLEEKVNKEGLILTEGQIRVMERRKEEGEIMGEIITEHPGYLGSQDTYYVGTIKGVGRIYQQSFIDTYSRVAIAKLYNTRESTVAADILNDRVLTFFEEKNVPLLRILTDRGTEYCGRVEEHHYELYLAINGIEHSKSKARHPQTNGIVERFHRTILEEFYQVVFRKKIYSSIEELQKDLDDWLKFYNEGRPHQGKRCLGKTPMETFNEGMKIVLEKIINSLQPQKLELEGGTTYEDGLNDFELTVQT